MSAPASHGLVKKPIPPGAGRGAGELDVGNARLLRCLDDRRRGLEREGAADDDVDVIPDQLVQLLDLRGNAVVGDPDDHLADVLVLVAELLNAAYELGAERVCVFGNSTPTLYGGPCLGFQWAHGLGSIGPGRPLYAARILAGRLASSPCGSAGI